MAPRREGAGPGGAPDGSPPGGPRPPRADILRRLFPERALAREVDEELRFHVEERVEELVARGVDPAEARRSVLAAFGDVDAIRAECRAIGRQELNRNRRRETMGGLARDIGVAARRLRRSPAFSALAVATLALGIGFSVAMFSVLYEVVLRPLPYAEPDRLVRVWPGKTFNAAMVHWFDRQVPAFERTAGGSGWGFTLLGDDGSERVTGAVVTPGYFELLGVRPVLGRTFLPEEEHPDQAGVVVLSHAFWQRRFGGDPAILGRDLPLETHGRPRVHRVVGVLPADFRPPEEDPEVWAPLQLAPGRSVTADSSWYVSPVLARLAPGATIEQAAAQVRAATLRLREETPVAATEEEARAAGVAVLLDDLVGEVRPLLWALLGSVGLVLLIACANLSTLLLARSAGERGEGAVRAALGASRGRLLAERLVESGVLAALGGAAGVAVAAALLALFRGGMGAALPRAAAVSLSVPALGFALAVSVGSLLLFALLPALGASAAAPGEVLRGGARPGAGGRRHRLDRGLVTVEVALTALLLVGAGLALRSFVAVLGTDPGLRTGGVVAVTIEPPVSQLTTGAERRAFYAEVESRFRALPGVEAAGSIHLLPLTQNNWSYPYLAEGHPPPENAPLPSANFRAVTPGYFATVGIPLLQGRPFGPSDRQGGEAVIIINRRMAERLWPGESPLGREIRIFGSMPTRVVGVVGDVRQHALDVEPAAEMYVPYDQQALSSMVVLVRAPGAPDATIRSLREVVWAVNPAVAVPRVVPLEEVLAESMAQRRFFVQLMLGFGGLALFLAGFGVYGVTAYLVSRRLPEFGLRLALGARPAQVVREALLWGLAPVALGAALGLAASLVGTRLIASLLYGVEPIDPPTLAGVLGVLGAVALLANLLPARRAARLDPSAALRAE